MFPSTSLPGCSPSLLTHFLHCRHFSWRPQQGLFPTLWTKTSFSTGASSVACNLYLWLWLPSSERMYSAQVLCANCSGPSRIRRPPTSSTAYPPMSEMDSPITGPQALLRPTPIRSLSTQDSPCWPFPQTSIAVSLSPLLFPAISSRAPTHFDGACYQGARSL